MISTGSVMRSKVIITKRGLGSPRALLCVDVDSAAACSAVERRETNMDPTLPGSPVDGQLIFQHILENRKVQ